MQNIMRLFTYLFAALFFSTAFAAELPIKPLEPQPVDKEIWTESRTMFGLLEDGSYIRAHLMLTNVGMGSQKGACRLLFKRPGQPPISDTEKGKRDDWFFDAQSESLTINRCTLRNARYGLVLDGVVKEYTFKMVFSKRAVKTSVPRGRVELDEDFYEYELYVPWSDVSVTWTKETQAPLKLKGRGFVDHSRSTTMPRKLASRWMRFAGIEVGNEAMFRLRYPGEDEAPEGWFFGHGQQGPVLWAAPSVEGLDKMPEADEFSFSVNVNGQKYAVQVLGLIYRYAPLEEMNGFLAAVARPWVGRPVSKTYRAVLTAPDGKKHTGILEIANNNK